MEKTKRVYTFSEILPDNERVREKVRLVREAEERKAAEELLKKKKDDEFKSEKEKKQKREEYEREQRRLELESQQQNYEDKVKSIQQGEGNLNEIFDSIWRNTSAYEIAFENYYIEKKRDFTTLMILLQQNSSLLTLSLARKSLGDNEAALISAMLIENKKLRRLELEGNSFGPLSGVHFANALKENQTLRYLDLESNNLTNHGKDISGVQAMLEALKSNTMLLVLNLSNNHLTADCGSYIVSLLRSNKILIHFEYFDNKDFEERPQNEKNDKNSKYKSNGLYITQIHTIKDLLRENKEAYVKMRTDEWHERKQMTSEFDDNIEKIQYFEKKKAEEEIKVKDKKDIEKLYGDDYTLHKTELEKQFTEDVKKAYEETLVRLAKKNKKRPVKKKK